MTDFFFTRGTKRVLALVGMKVSRCAVLYVPVLNHLLVHELQSISLFIRQCFMKLSSSVTFGNGWFWGGFIS